MNVLLLLYRPVTPPVPRSPSVASEAAAPREASVAESVEEGEIPMDEADATAITAAVGPAAAAGPPARLSPVHSAPAHPQRQTLLICLISHQRPFVAS